MKWRLFIAALILPLALASCAPAANADPFLYQDRPAEVTATLTTDTGKVSFVITLPPAADAVSRRDAVIRLTAPETLSGITVSATGQVIEISSGDVKLPVSAEAGERWLSVIGLFCLDRDSVTSVTEENGGVTVAVGSEPERIFVSFDAGEAVPKEIKTEGGELSLSVEKYKFTDTGSEGVE